MRPQFRCPLAMLRSCKESTGVRRAFELYGAYHKHGVLPTSDGVARQSASLFRAFRIAGAETAAIEQEQRAEMERERDREALRSAARR